MCDCAAKLEQKLVNYYKELPEFKDATFLEHSLDYVGYFPEGGFQLTGLFNFKTNRVVNNKRKHSVRTIYPYCPLCGQPYEGVVDTQGNKKTVSVDKDGVNN